jgi:hypothetical protein
MGVPRKDPKESKPSKPKPIRIMEQKKESKRETTKWENDKEKPEEKK